MGAYINRALVFCYLEQTPNRNSSITLTSTIDKYGRSVPEINWIFNESDMHEASKVSEYMFNSFAESRNFYFKPYELKLESFVSGAHHAGTMKIGSDQRNGVIDNNLKIFGTNNIYVCDLSIFPKYGNSNPTLTLSAFSVRLSQHLLQRIT
jgi:choline dehydrogenase-like flavoprotein